MRSAGVGRGLPGLFGAVLLAGMPPGVPVVHAGPKWDPVPAEQMALASPSIEPGADAEVLLWSVEVEDRVERGTLSIRRHFVRVKVFTAEGAQTWSMRSIDYPSHEVTLSELAARTVQSDGSIRIMEKAATSVDVLAEGGGQRIRRTSFALPEVRPGSIVEFRYTETHAGRTLPTHLLELQFGFPVHKVVYRVRPLSRPGLTVRQLMFHTPVRPSSQLVNGYYETVATRVPALALEPDMPPILQQAGFMLVVYSADEQEGSAGFWSAIGRRQSIEFDDLSTPDRAIRAEVAALVAGSTSDRERVERIARRVRECVRVLRGRAADSLGGYGRRTRTLVRSRAGREMLEFGPRGSAPDPRAAFREGRGTQQEALLVFGAMLRAAGLEARWVRSSTRARLFFDPAMVSEGLLEYDLVAVRLDGQWRTFDPVTECLPWDMQSWSAEGTLALLCDRDSSAFLVTPVAPPERSTRARSARLELRPDGSLEGLLRISFSGHLNAAMRNRLTGLRAPTLDRTVALLLGGEGSALEITEARLLNPDSPAEPLRVVAHMRLPAHATIAPSRVLLEPAVFDSRVRPRYTGGERVHPVYYEHPWCELDTIRIRLPEGWSVESPEVIEPRFADGAADYVACLEVSPEGSEITYVRRFRVGVDGLLHIPRDRYEAVRRFFDDIRARDAISLSIPRPEQP